MAGKAKQRETQQDKKAPARDVRDTKTENSPEGSGGRGLWGDPTEPPLMEVSFEELMELQDELDGDDSLGDVIDTRHTDGSTDDVQLAMEQGLVYTPPTDPPVVPSDDPQGVEIATGFASSIEDEPEVENLPASVDDNDSDAEDDIRKALHYNSETTHLDHVRVYVRNGVAYLRGRVLDEADSDIVAEFVRDLEAVDEIRNEIEVVDQLR